MSVVFHESAPGACADHPDVVSMWVQQRQVARSELKRYGINRISLISWLEMNIPLCCPFIYVPNEARDLLPGLALRDHGGAARQARITPSKAVLV